MLMYGYNSPYVGQAPFMMQQQPTFNQPQPTIPQLSGRMVNDFNEVTANDVPMNGNPAIFIKNDGSEIQVRRWNNMGMIDMTLFKPFYEPKREEVVNVSADVPIVDLNPLEIGLRSIEESIAQLSNKIDLINKPTTPTRSKKEVANE